MSVESELSATADFPILRSLVDAANLVTVSGLCAAVAGIYAALCGQVYLGAALLGLALLCDMLDGNVARRFPNRPVHLSRLGIELDSLSDVIHGGVLPGVLLNVMTGFAAWSMLAAVVLCVCVVVRLAHFNVFGLTDASAYSGMPVIFNSLATALLVAIAPSALAPVTLLVALLVFAALNVSNLRMPKIQGRSLHVFIGVNLVAIVANLAFAMPPLVGVGVPI